MKLSTNMLVICLSMMAGMAQSWENTKVFNMGPSVASGITSEGCRNILKEYEKAKPTFMLSYLGKDNPLNREQMSLYMETLDYIADTGTEVLHLDTQWNNRWRLDDPDVYHTRGNLSFNVTQKASEK